MSVWLSVGLQEAEAQLCPAAGQNYPDTFPVVVTSYEIVLADAKALQSFQWKYVVVDEGHRLKNYNSKLLRELRQMNSANRLLLTGWHASQRVSSQSICYALSL